MKKLSRANERMLKKLYERSKSGMLQRFGRVLSYEEFIATMAYAHKHKKVK